MARLTPEQEIRRLYRDHRDSLRTAGLLTPAAEASINASEALELERLSDDS